MRRIITAITAVALALSLAASAAPANAAVPGYDSAYAGESAFLTLAPGQSGTFTVFFANTGTTSWVRGTASQVDLAACLENKTTCNAQDASEAPFNSGWLSATRYATHTQTTVAPGQIGTFTYNVTVPATATAGTYRFNGALVLASTGADIHNEGYYQDVTIAAVVATPTPTPTPTPTTVPTPTLVPTPVFPGPPPPLPPAGTPPPGATGGAAPETNPLDPIHDYETPPTPPTTPAPPPGPPPVACNVGTNSGGAGVTRTTHQLGQPSGTFQFRYQAFSVPDQFEIFYQGTRIFTTGGPVSGGATVPVTYSGTATTIEVVVTGPSGTAWNYTVSCPAT